ncbi:MAG: hypothetical protein WCA54_09580 [Pseudolabrys sp.]
MTTAAHSDLEYEERPRQKRKFLILPFGVHPDRALLWTPKNYDQRNERLRLWRISVSRTFPAAARALRVAWALETLFHKFGYAYPTDARLAKETGIGINHVQEALHILDDGGAIIRVHRPNGEQMQRHIYPATTLIDSQGGGWTTPRLPGGENKYRKTTSSTANAARLQAERNERRNTADD